MRCYLPFSLSLGLLCNKCVEETLTNYSACKKNPVTNMSVMLTYALCNYLSQQENAFL